MPMKNEMITEEKDLRYLNWSHARTSSGTAGTFLKSQEEVAGIKKYYKLSNFDAVQGIIGHECINEIVVDRLLTVLGVEHLRYELIKGRIAVDGKEYTTFLCASSDFKKRGESKAALDDFYRVNSEQNESPFDFCKRMGWQDGMEQMLAVDYLILNRDRHGANIEILRNTGAKTLRLAPIFDHGLSLLCSCQGRDQIRKFDVLEDKPCNNFIGTKSCYENLSLIRNPKRVFAGKLQEEDKGFILAGLEEALPAEHLEKIWSMIYERYKIYEAL